MDLTAFLKSGRSGAVLISVRGALAYLWSLSRSMLVVCACLSTCGAGRVAAQLVPGLGTFPPALTRLLPAGAVVVKVLDVDFAGDGTRSMAISYGLSEPATARESAPMDSNAKAVGLRVLRFERGSWKIVFDDAVSGGRAAGDSLDAEIIRSANGRQGVVEVTRPGQAGAAASWRVVAEDGDQFMKLDPKLILDKVFREEGYTDSSPSSARVERDAVVETQAGSWRNAGMCCQSRPPYVISVRFTGTSLALGSVRWLLLARTTGAPHTGIANTR